LLRLPSRHRDSTPNTEKSVGTAFSQRLQPIAQSFELPRLRSIWTLCSHPRRDHLKEHRGAAPGRTGVPTEQVVVRFLTEWDMPLPG